MDNSVNVKTNGSSVWPYVIAGSAIGGALGYLFMTESGRKVRYSLTHPDEMSNNLDGARNFIESKTRMVTNQVHSVLGRAKRSIDEGQVAYREANQEFRAKARQFEAKNAEITSTVHDTVDNMNRTAVSIEESVLDPICEIGALYRGIERGIRSLLGKPPRSNRMIDEGPVPIYSGGNERMMG